MIEAEWASFKDFELAETAIPNKYKELIGLAVSGASSCVSNPVPSRGGQRRRLDWSPRHLGHARQERMLAR
jgi:hypothetical protein